VGIEKGLMMNKKVYKLGLIASVLTLLVGCANTNPNSSTTEDTSTIEETGTLETEITSENTNSLEKHYEVNYQYDAIVVTQDYGIFPVDNTTPYQDLITKTVDIHNFASHFEQTGGRGIDDVMEFMGVECLRETEAGALYSVHKVEQGGLLYIFYSNHEWETEIRTNEIKAWFYVRERLSFSDFDSLQSGVTTIEDVIEMNEVEQILFNCYRADPMFQYDPTQLVTVHYLEDGIFALQYDLINGELIFVQHYLAEDFDLPFSRESKYYPYYAQVLDMDRVE
jgi:hypothetical protein